MAHYDLGNVLKEQRKPDEAVVEYRAAARLDAEQGHVGSALGALGTTLRELGRPDEALDSHTAAMRTITAAMQINPAAPRPWSDRGRLLATLGRWREARDDLEHALDLDPANHLDWYRAATLDLWLGDREGYRRRCLAILDRFEATADPWVADYLSKVCLLDPRPHEGWARAERLAERATSEKAPSWLTPWSKMTRALAADRAGRPAEAIEWARRSTPDGSMYAEILSQLVLALASHREGRAVEAGLWLDLARRSIAARTPALNSVPLPVDEWHDLLHVHLLLREAESLIGGVPGLVPEPRADPTPLEGVRLRAELGRGYARLAALQVQKKRVEAADTYRAAGRLLPDDAPAHFNLGNVLIAQGKRDEAVAEYRAAARLDAERGHVGNAIVALGTILREMGRPDETVAIYRQILEKSPSDAAAHLGLTNELKAQGNLDEAIAEYRAVIQLKPDDAEAHCELGHTLVMVGDYAEAIAMYRKGQELGSKRTDWKYPVAQGIAEAERLAALAERLPAVLKGDDRPRDAAERLALAQFCHDTRRHAAAARFWAAALEAEPKLGDDRRAGHRYNAACSAALAAAGRGRDDPPPDDDAKTRLRSQALGWLRAERDAWAKRLDGNDPKTRDLVARTLQHWKSDPDLAGVRDPEALAKLPEAERTAWRDLWADVDALLKRSEGARP